MKYINNIDLWTEAKENHQECFDGAFTDGFGSESIPFDSFKIVKNCNCNIISFPRININNKHNAIVFYKDGEPVRLLVANKNTNVDECISKALNQEYNGDLLLNLFIRLNINSTTVDMKEEPKERIPVEKEAEVGSTDRAALLKSMLKGSWTEEESSIGHDSELMLPKNQRIIYMLPTDTEYFRIDHSFAFENKQDDRIIPIQKGFKQK